MSDITIRKNAPLQPQAIAREADPYRIMRDLLRWEPLGELSGLWPEARAAVFAPAFEVKETVDSYVFRADVPGVLEQDLSVTMTGNRLSISGGRREEAEQQSDTYYASERAYGSFNRSYTLPDGADGEHVHADLKNGVLSVVVPKKPGVQAKRIAVKTGEKGLKA